jgi:hypothetical protein
MEGSSATSSAVCSSMDYASEKFDWVNRDTFPKEYKLEYLKFPLEEWKDIVFKKNLFDDSTITSYGDYYQEIVNRILEYNIFKDYNFYWEKGGKIGYKLDKYTQEVKIAPDFFVYRMKKSQFDNLLRERKYMMKSFYEIPESVKYISILGEIKMSRKEAVKKSHQKRDYEKFARIASNEEEKVIIMYIFDESFSFFKEDLQKTDEKPKVYCYIPKLYHKKCYQAYNSIVDKFQQKNKKINLDTDGKYAEQRDLLKELLKAKSLIRLLIYGYGIIFIGFIIYYFLSK